MAAHDDVHRLVTLARDIVDRVPERALPGAPRHRETRDLRSTPGGGGVARAELLDRLNAEMQVMVGHLCLVAGGVTDALAIADQRDNQVNGPSLAYVVRPALELAGQVAWMLTDQISAQDRARRHVAWRLADLRAQRLLLRDFRESDDLIDEARKELDEDEAELLATVAAAKWHARPTTYNGDHLEAAALLGSSGKPEGVPPLGELVREVSSTPATYGLLSVTTHSQRFGVLQGLKVVSSPVDGQAHAQMSGFPLSTNLLIGLTVLALNLPGRMLGGWNGIDTTELHRFSGQLINKAGLR